MSDDLNNKAGLIFENWSNEDIEEDNGKSVYTDNGKVVNKDNNKTVNKIKKTFSLTEEQVDMIYEIKIKHKDLNFSEIVGQAIQYLHQNIMKN